MNKTTPDNKTLVDAIDGIVIPVISDDRLEEFRSGTTPTIPELLLISEASSIPFRSLVSDRPDYLYFGDQEGSELYEAVSWLMELDEYLEDQGIAGSVPSLTINNDP